MRDFELRAVVVEIQDVEAGGLIEAHRGRADVQLRACILIVPELIAGGERAVDLRVRPVGRAGRFGGHRAGHVVQTRNASRRIGVLRRGDLGSGLDFLRDAGLGSEQERSGRDKGVARDAAVRVLIFGECSHDLSPADAAFCFIRISLYLRRMFQDPHFCKATSPACNKRSH
ncbi:hypothetical protein GGD41_000568 [Paraburkholderia bryophila]|uniref:Uncharacterized protein n=1 Tax=Paraburkholderia bryophila TaxID=420952 RepID=A0A7Z0AYB5_9BURK|nr:hypothetical protein [Paraburkholderia bryophila]